jgi:hypothetical protein
MEQHQLLGNKVQDSIGIKQGFVRKVCVYAGSSWALQRPKTNFVKE